MSDDKPQGDIERRRPREVDFDRFERNKDIAQEVVQTTATRVGRIATIITGAVADVAREIGDLVTDGFEMREAAKRAKADAERLDRLAQEHLDDGLDVEELDDEFETGELDAGPGESAEITRSPQRKAIEAPVEDQER
ncbi:hypothetical protein GOARA_067_00800 [Gordonia araii NBRC 100433]|uniref:Uncharacterized protein n=1 Tax=Gordonia araii NBRC 100433 TaxID=1073574 RepID=G7H616_9ACTN|nr:hypothetical protein [Gordonia araii]GAB11338.1 hypothetical protein GOARA_067_00800 [Gordonia araii NBRC 100433]